MRDTELNIEEALDDPRVGFVMDLFGQARAFEAPPFAGGVLTDWPALVVDTFPILRGEDAAIDAWYRHLKGADHG